MTVLVTEDYEYVMGLVHGVPMVIPPRDIGHGLHRILGYFDKKRDDVEYHPGGDGGLTRFEIKGKVITMECVGPVNYDSIVSQLRQRPEIGDRFVAVQANSAGKWNNSGCNSVLHSSKIEKIRDNEPWKNIETLAREESSV